MNFSFQTEVSSHGEQQNVHFLPGPWVSGGTGLGGLAQKSLEVCRDNEMGWTSAKGLSDNHPFLKLAETAQA